MRSNFNSLLKMLQNGTKRTDQKSIFRCCDSFSITEGARGKGQVQLLPNRLGTLYNPRGLERKANRHRYCQSRLLALSLTNGQGPCVVEAVAIREKLRYLLDNICDGTSGLS